MTINDRTAPSAPYSLRPAVAADASVIAHHRALMFWEMGILVDEAEFSAIYSASIPWLRELLAQQEYLGWLVLLGAAVVAGGGLHLGSTGPVPGCSRGGQSGHIANIYTVQTHRRKGLARLVLGTILQWAETNLIDHLTLTPSDAGRPLYQSLGFVDTPQMKLKRG